MYHPLTELIKSGYIAKVDAGSFIGYVRMEEIISVILSENDGDNRRGNGIGCKT